MQRMDSLDSASNKIVFKKQNHRPWTPPIQKDTPVLFESNTELSGFDSERLLIGGFSFPKAQRILYEPAQSQQPTAIIDQLKSKEQEAQTLSTNLKVASALEHAEKIELSRKKEMLARTIAEEKALNAIQQLKLTEVALQKTKQQLQIEQQLKNKEESIKQSLEIEIKNALRTIEDNENIIAREIEIRRIAEEKLNEMLNFFSKKEHHIRLEAEKTIRDNLRKSIEREKNIEQTLEDRVNSLQNEHKEQTLKIQCGAELKIAEAEEKICFHRKAKIEAQQWLQKSQEATRQIEIQKTEVESNLAAIIQNATDQKSQCESVINDLRLQISKLNEKIALMDSANFSLKQQVSENLSKLNSARQTESNTTAHIESLNLQIQQFTEKLIALENEKAELTTQFTDTLGKSKILQSIASNERRLRILLEKKFSEKEVGKMIHNKKLFEEKIFKLTEKLKALEFEKAKIQENHNNALDEIHKTKTLLADEKTKTKSLEEKNKLLAEQIYSLEQAKQKEIHEKETATHKVSELVAQKQHLEREKTNLEEKYNVLVTRSDEFKIMLASEQSLRKESERLKIIEEQARKADQEKMSSDIAQANNTALTVLGKYTTAKEKNKLLTEQIYSLEQAKQKEIHEKETATHKVSELVTKQQHLEQEKTKLEEKYNMLVTQSVEFKIMIASEQSLRKESERLKMIAEQERKADQEKMSSDMAQANSTISTVLSKYAVEKEKNKLITEQLNNLEHARQKETHEKETATHKVSELVAKQQHLEQEKINLEEKNKLIIEKIYSLEQAKQKEIEQKETATHKVSELVIKQQHLEQEKEKLEEKYKILSTRAAELKILLESEQCLRKEAEKLKIIEENTRKTEQEKISSAMKQANKTILTVLGHYTTTEVSND